MPVVKKLQAVAALFILPLVLCGQDFPVIKDNPDISTGKLANGISYYLVKNVTSNSHADVALVQKGRKPDMSVRQALVDLPHFHNSRPYAFLARNGMGYSSYGYSYSNELATVFRFCDVPMFDTYASDSTLMLLFDLAQTYPKSQAIVISGDIDKSKILERMNVLSMVVSARGEAEPEYRYHYEPEPGIIQTSTRNTSAEMCRLSVCCFTDRTPEDYLKTAVPFVTGMYSNQFGYIATGRLRRAMSLEGVNVTDLKYDYQGSSDSPGMERHMIEFTVRLRDIHAATAVLASVLSQMESEGVGHSELDESKRAVQLMNTLQINDITVSNSSYLDKCISAYLYGSSMASGSTISTLFTNKVLDSDTELALFNSFVKALLSRSGRYELNCSFPDRFIGDTDLTRVFASSWEKASSGQVQSFAMSELDTTALNASLRKVKIKTEVTEPMTGGKLLTFNNGIRVIYKEMSYGGYFKYGMVLRGGPNSVPDIRYGESAFLSDILMESRICGLDPQELRRLNSINGMTLDVEVTLSDLRFTGTAPASELGRVIELLYGIGYCRSYETPDYNNFASKEKLMADAEELSDRGIRTIIDERLNTENSQSFRRSVTNLRQDLHQRANDYFDNQFSKCNDGVLVFIGDIPEATLKEVLGNTLGSFAVSGRHSYRGQVRSGNKMLWSTETVHGDPGVTVGLNATKGYSIAQYMTLRLAMLALSNDLKRRCAEVGVTVDLFSEDGNLYITCHDCLQSGLPSNVSTAAKSRVLAQIRASLTHMASDKLSAEMLNFCKSELQSEFASASADPEIMMEYTIRRYGEGRDYLTGYKDAIKSVTANDVRNVLRQFSNASRVEVIAR